MAGPKKRGTPYEGRGSRLAQTISYGQDSGGDTSHTVFVHGRSFAHPPELVSEIVFLRAKLQAARQQIATVSRQHAESISRSLAAERKLRRLKSLDS